MVEGLLIASLLVVVAALLALGWVRQGCGPRMIWTLKSQNGLIIKGEIMAITLTSTQFVDGVLQPVDSKGRPAKVEAGSVKFESSNPEIFSVEQNPENELEVRITALSEGVAELRFSADADLDDGEVVLIEGFAAVEVLPAMAIGFGISFGTPQEQTGDSTSSTTSTSTTL
jgi:hypothetical protein